MEIRDLISKNIQPVKLDDKLSKAFEAFEVYHVNTLPVIDEKGKYIALLRKNMLDNDPELLVSDIVEKFVTGTREAIRVDEHFYEIISKYHALESTIVPIVDKDNKLLGVVSGQRYMEMFSASFSFVEPGSILTLFIPKTDYSMAEIAQIVESEGGAILSSIIHSSEDDSAVHVTLKINLNNLSAIVQSFERHKYKVIARFSERDYQDVLKNRFDELMNYLNV